MKIKKISIILIMLFVSFFLIASTPYQDAPPETATWRGVFTTLIGLGVAVVGAPLTQVLKNVLKINDTRALVLSGLIAALIAVIELWLMGQLDFKLITAETFPQTFFVVFSVSGIYFTLFKRSEGVLGKGWLLKS